MSPLFAGIQMGLLLAFLAGPIFFTLLQTGIERGVRAGIAVSVGEISSDVIYICGAYFGLTWLMQQVDQALFKFYVGVLGGIILVVFGLTSLFSKPPEPTEAKAINAKTLFGFWAKGFAINTFNPFTLIFWMATTSGKVIAQHYSTLDAFAFYGGIIATICFFDIVKIWGAKKIRTYLQPRFLIWVRRIAGLGLLAFGLILILKVI
ncbi:MAG: hypothetical protein RI894_1087 [Bacteroidota bacterium]|jgi:threonine/homoserine/homoserine lactone efflux protein